MKKKLIAMFIVLVVICFFSNLWAVAQDENSEEDQEQEQDQTDQEDEDVGLEEVVVTGKKIVSPTKQTSDTVYTGSEITPKGMEIQGAKATISVYEAVDILPGVVTESIDPYGLAAEQRHIRTRGIKGISGAMTVVGVPNYGGNPMGPREYIYDTENLESIAVYKGAVPADLGTGVGARGGAIELRPRWPEKEPTIGFSQGFGENVYSRSFLRIDSGELTVLETALAASFSHTEADKWKGPGHLGPRNNASIMVNQPILELGNIGLWYNYHYTKQDLYRPLTYAEVENLHANYEKDFNRELSSIATEDIYYYKYNHGEHANHDAIAVIRFSLPKSFNITLKPFYSNEDAEIFNGLPSKGGTVRKRERDIERYGVISDFGWDNYSWLTASVGYWFESLEMDIVTKMYDPLSLDFNGYGMYMKSDDNGIIHSPYLKLAGSIESFNWQAGVKYFHYTEPASQGYTSPPPDYELTKADDLTREEKEYQEFLPTAGVSYRPIDPVELYTCYGRNQIRPYAYMPLINLYNQNRDTFQKAGVDLDELFSGYDMEISDSFELGARFRTDWLDVFSSVFYSKHSNLLVTVYDPRVDLSYYQNEGEATGYGVELGTNVYIKDYFTFFLNPTYTALTYDEDMTYQGTTLETKNNQVVDTPEWVVKSGMILSYKGFEVVPRAKYLGERYGDAEHEEKIGEYIVGDLSISYTREQLSFIDFLTFTFECNNIFQEEYISVIDAMDDTRAGNASYYVGPHRTVHMKLSLEF